MNQLIKKMTSLTNSIMIAGIMILLYGLYYLLAKGGVLIPFHDAPEDILWIYEAHGEVAKIIIKLGLIVLLAGIAYQIIKYFYFKYKSIKQKDNIINLMTTIMLGIVIASGLITLRGYIYLGDEFSSPVANIGIGYGFVRSIWSRLIVKTSIVFLASSLFTSIWIIVDKGQSNAIAYVILGIVWTIFCFLVFIWATFYGPWDWSTSELIANEPIIGRITVFLSNSMWMIWLAVPCIIAAILIIKKKKKENRIANQTVEQDSEVQ